MVRRRRVYIIIIIVLVINYSAVAQGWPESDNSTGPEQPPGGSNSTNSSTPYPGDPDSTNSTGPRPQPGDPDSTNSTGPRPGGSNSTNSSGSGIDGEEPPPGNPYPPPNTPSSPSPGSSGPKKPSKLYPLNEYQYYNALEGICPLVPQIGDKPRLPPWRDTMTKDDIFELALLNMAYGLTTDAIAHLPVSMSLGWKHKVISSIAYIARTTCNTPDISSRFLNGVKNFFMYYMYKKESAPEEDPYGWVWNDTNKTETGPNYTAPEEWKPIIEALSNCAAEVNPIKLITECAHEKVGHHGERYVEYIQADGKRTIILKQFEALDTELRGDDHGLDIIIDSMWWMFSTTFARCYAHSYPEEDVMLAFYQKFRDDIIGPFSNRWVQAGIYEKHFSIIFGPLNIKDEHFNIRQCAQAAYHYEKLGTRQLVRPLMIVEGYEPMRNYKQTRYYSPNGGDGLVSPQDEPNNDGDGLVAVQPK